MVQIAARRIAEAAHSGDEPETLDQQMLREDAELVLGDSEAKLHTRTVIFLYS